MLIYFKLLETFVLRVLFGKDEYNLRSKNFNPVKVLIISLLLLNVPFTGYLYAKLSDSYELIHRFCPLLIIEIERGSSKEELFEKLLKKTEKYCHH